MYIIILVLLIPDTYFLIIDTIKEMNRGDNLKNRISLNLLELRQQRNLTQKQLCEDLNLSRSVYSYFECERRMPDIDTLMLFADYYGVSLDELVSGTPTAAVKPAGDVSGSDSAVALARHLKAKHIPVESVLQMTKADFDFLSGYKKLSADNKAEIAYLTAYKIRKQAD